MNIKLFLGNNEENHTLYMLDIRREKSAIIIFRNMKKYKKPVHTF